MKGFIQIKLLAAGLFLAISGTAQSGAYAKFDSSGEIIGLFNLSGEEGSCSDAQRLSGIVRNVRSEIRKPDIIFNFSLVSNDRRRIVGFSLKNDTVPRADIEKLLIINGKVRIAVAACRSGTVWTAHQITRE